MNANNVKPASIAAQALAKVASKHGTPARSFGALLAELGTLMRNICRIPGAGPDSSTFEVLTTPNPSQSRALALAQTIQV